MNQVDFPINVMGLISSISRPLLSSFILIDDLIQEEDHDSSTKGSFLELSHQIQSAIEYLLELRALTMAILESGITVQDDIKEKSKKEWCKEFFCGILIVILLSMSITICKVS